MFLASFMGYLDLTTDPSMSLGGLPAIAITPTSASCLMSPPWTLLRTLVIALRPPK